MIDKQQRAVVANAIEAYLNGSCDNYVLDDVLSSIRSDDVAIEEVCLEMYRFYADFSKHSCREMPLKTQYEAGVRRWLVLLRSDTEWPLPPRYSPNPVVRICQVIASVMKTTEKTAFTKNPYWPFNDESDWQAFAATYAVQSYVREQDQRDRQLD